MDFLLGHTYEILDLQLNRVSRLLVSGIFRIDTGSPAYWHANLEDLERTFYITSG
jgi:hypothetical protein